MITVKKFKNIESPKCLTQVETKLMKIWIHSSYISRICANIKWFKGQKIWAKFCFDSTWVKNIGNTLLYTKFLAWKRTRSHSYKTFYILGCLSKSHKTPFWCLKRVILYLSFIYFRYLQGPILRYDMKVYSLSR